MLQLLREGYSFTYPPLSVLPGTHFYSAVNCGNVGWSNLPKVRSDRSGIWNRVLSVESPVCYRAPQMTIASVLSSFSRRLWRVIRCLASLAHHSMWTTASEASISCVPVTSAHSCMLIVLQVVCPEVCYQGQSVNGEHNWAQYRPVWDAIFDQCSPGVVATNAYFLTPVLSAPRRLK